MLILSLVIHSRRFLRTNQLGGGCPKEGARIRARDGSTNGLIPSRSSDLLESGFLGRPERQPWRPARKAPPHGDQRLDAGVRSAESFGARGESAWRGRHGCVRGGDR